MSSAHRRATLGLVAIVGMVGLAWATGLMDAVRWEALVARREALQAAVAAAPARSLALFAALYSVSAAASLPFATPLTLAGAALFGFVPALWAVSLASTAGALLATASARWLFADAGRARFPAAVARVDEGLARDGLAWLLALRLAPVMPFVAVNLALGLTAVPLRTVLWTSWIGMLPGTAVYVWVGSEVGLIGEPRDLLHPRLWLAFVALAALPFAVRPLAARLRARG